MNKNIFFENSFFNKEQIYNLKKKQIIFVGKSNVGKSSIINNILNMKVARTANKPGKTQSINIYNVQEKFYMIDVPGYGYSIASKKIQLYWKYLIETFLTINRNNIKFFIYILDIRHNPTDNDLIMLKYIQNINIPYLILLNKCDKLNIKNSNEIITLFKKKLLIDQNFENILIFSAKDKKYRKNVFKKILNSLNLMEGDLNK